jgi:hypothetical protein
MREIRTDIEISASASVVWRTLCNFDEYSDWNPFITEAVGLCAAGERLTLRMGPVRGRHHTLRPRVLEVEAERTLRWIGRVLGRGFFDGEHIFEIEPVSDGRVRFVQRERFRGILVPVLLPLVEADTRGGFEAMNAALRDRAEARRGG